MAETLLRCLAPLLHPNTKLFVAISDIIVSFFLLRCLAPLLRCLAPLLRIFAKDAWHRNKERPAGFRFNPGALVSPEEYDNAVQKYYNKYKIDEATLKEEERLRVTDFSITAALGKGIHEATRTFYEKRARIQPFGVRFFIILAIAYIALLLNIKTNLAESVSPLIWGNLPLANRGSEIMKILWRIPESNVLRNRIYLFFMLPILITLAITLLSTGQKTLDLALAPYSSANIILTALFSLAVTTYFFYKVYQWHVTGISTKNAMIGAFIAAALWLGGRWFFTTYAAVTLHRNLRNFAFIPIFLTWFYYFCTVFIFGLFVAHTLENPNLSSTARYWVMRYIGSYNRYFIYDSWVRLDFLYRLVVSRYEEQRPPFIDIDAREDTADEIARNSNLPPTFVRECIMEMIARNRRAFHVEVEGNRQYCKLKAPPEEVAVMPLLLDPSEFRVLTEETENYSFGAFIRKEYGPFWQAKAIMLSDVYRNYKSFCEKARISRTNE